MVPQGLSPGNDPLPHSVAIAAPQCRGVVVASVAEALAPLFAALPDTAQLQLVKQSRVRSVLRGSFGGVDVHVKLFRTATLSDRAKGSVRGSRGSREARNLLAAAALGLPTATPLACGEIRTPDEPGARAFLVTATIAGASEFAFDLPAPVLAATGRLLRRAHDAGALPPDLHPGNLVVDAEQAPWLLDLASLTHTGDADPGRRAAALAFFCQQLDAGPLAPRAQPLLLAYLAAGRELPPDFASLLAQAARAVRSRALAAFGRRSSRECRHTAVPPRVRGQWRWYLHQVEDVADRGPLHAACLAFAASPPAPAKTGRRGSLWLADDLVVKQRDPGKAQRLFRAAYWLLFARVPQAEPVALARRAGRGLVFARRLPMPSVHDEIARGLAGVELRAAAASLGDGVGRLHAHGLRNRDLKLQNLVRDPANSAVCMVDLDGVRRKRPSDARGQGADLGRLFAAFTAAGSPGGRSTVSAFARAYLRARQRLLQPAPARRLWRRAAERARQWASAHR